jgi:hypothetical protein
MLEGFGILVSNSEGQPSGTRDATCTVAFFYGLHTCRHRRWQLQWVSVLLQDTVRLRHRTIAHGFMPSRPRDFAGFGVASVAGWTSSAVESAMATTSHPPKRGRVDIQPADGGPGGGERACPPTTPPPRATLPGRIGRRHARRADHSVTARPLGPTKVVPSLVEDELKRLGGLCEKAPDWASFVVTEGRLVTGQTRRPPERGAEALLQLLA